MSLSQHVSSIEEYEPSNWGGRHSRDASPAGSVRRKLSYNPVSAEWIAPVAAEEPVGAFEVSRGKRLAQVVVAVVYCLLAAGIVFGYAALKPVLVREGAYRWTCTEEELKEGVHVCYEQELRLNFMFTVAAVSTNVCALPVGTVLDRYGPRVCGIIGAVFIAIGCLFLAFAFQLPFDGYVPGYLFLALGGPFIFISSFQLSNTFPRYSGLILALLTGAFDSSSAVFLFYRLLYQATDGAFYPRRFFLLYLVVPLFILIAQLTLMPAVSYKTVGELLSQAEAEAELPSGSSDSSIRAASPAAQQPHAEPRRPHRRASLVSDITSLLGTSAPAEAPAIQKKEEHKKDVSQVWGVLHGLPARQQLRTPWFWLITLFTVLQMTRINHFVATIRPQYAFLLDSYPAAVRLNHVFDVALPAGGVLSIPLVGLVLDHCSTPTALASLVVGATLIGALGLLRHPAWAAYVHVALFVLYRPFYYTAVSDYAAKVFGFASFGKVYGTLICLAGLANFAQTGLEAITLRACGGDPRPVNVGLLVAGVVLGAALVGYVGFQARALRRRAELERQAWGAEERVVPVPGPVAAGGGGGEREGLLGSGGVSARDYGAVDVGRGEGGRAANGGV